MKKLLTLFAAAMLSWVGAYAQTDAEYYDALASIDNGAQYYITTDVSGTKYYLTTSGFLTNEIASAGQFTMTQVTGGQYKSTGFQIYGTSYFSNHSSNDTSYPDNSLHTDDGGRVTWDAQVLFLNSSGKYAVRSTNADEPSNGWNAIAGAFWTVKSGPYAGYSDDVNYIWNFEKVGDVTYTALSATKFNNGEGAEKLIDGIGQTKWGETVNTGTPRWLIFKTERAIKATEYMLTVANDTPGSTGRQWKKWKIYGANFYSDALAAASTGNEGWELLDQKEITNNDDFPTGSENNTYSYTDFTMSENNTGYYQYFKIVVEELRSSGQYGQMGDFRFKTFSAKTETETWTSKVTLAKAVNFDPQTLGTSYPLYTELQSLLNSELDSYLSTAISSGDYTTLSKKLNEVYSLHYFMSTYLNGRDFLAVTGSDGCWGDGHYDNLVDGDNKTKWGGDFPGSGEKVMWMIFRAKEKIKPYFYKLLTAWDAASYGGRNWKNWTLSGANFTKLEDVERISSSWTTIDNRENVGPDLLPAKNGHLAPFGVNGTFDEEYYYFKVEVTAAYTDNSIQMNELTLGTEEEFNATKAEYMAELNGYTVPEEATTEQKQNYANAKTEVQNATPENILEKYNEAKSIQMDIFTSIKDGDYYLISSPIALELFSDRVNTNTEANAKGKLTKDIDLEGYNITEIGATTTFTGTFDGQNFTISNLSLNDPAGQRTGLFALVNGATIQNLVIDNATVSGLHTVGIVVGNPTGGATIQNVIVKNSVATGRGDRFGGIVGEANNSTVQNCAVLNSSLTGGSYAGAIVGNAVGGATIQNCYSNSPVVATGNYAGGIAGAAKAATFTKNLFTGTIKSAGMYASGLVGLFNVQDDNNFTLTIQKNMVAAPSVTGSGTSALMYKPTLPTGQDEPTYSGNYSLKSTSYSTGAKDVTNPDDHNGKQIDWVEATTKDFYETTLGWYFTDDWKFTCGGKYPILMIMADEALPTQDLAITAEAGYATMVAKYDYDFTGASFEAFAVTESEKESVVHLEPVTSAKHGEALLLKKENGVNFTQTATATAQTAATGNLLKASDGSVTGGEGIYALAKKVNGVGFYPVDASVTIPEGKAYLEVATNTGGGGVKAFYGFEEDDATGISLMEDGRSKMEDAAIYNVAGQRLNKMQKGINIVNGKKILK